MLKPGVTESQHLIGHGLGIAAMTYSSMPGVASVTFLGYPEAALEASHELRLAIALLSTAVKLR